MRRRRHAAASGSWPLVFQSCRCSTKLASPLRCVSSSRCSPRSPPRATPEREVDQNLLIVRRPATSTSARPRRAGAGPRVASRDGETPLVGIRGDVALVRLLVLAGGDVNARPGAPVPPLPWYLPACRVRDEHLNLPVMRGDSARVTAATSRAGPGRRRPAARPRAVAAIGGGRPPSPRICRGAAGRRRYPRAPRQLGRHAHLCYRSIPPGRRPRVVRGPLSGGLGRGVLCGVLGGRALACAGVCFVVAWLSNVSTTRETKCSACVGKEGDFCCRAGAWHSARACVCRDAHTTAGACARARGAPHCVVSTDGNGGDAQVVRGAARPSAGVPRDKDASRRPRRRARPRSLLTAAAAAAAASRARSRAATQVDDRHLDEPEEVAL